jgi:amino acid transporter
MDASEPRYEQELSRSIKVLGNIAITLSAVTPASSVFIIAPVAVVAAGTGSFWAFVIAAALGIVLAFCWGELSAAFPVAGGDYALVGRALRGRFKPLSGPVSFITFALMLSQIAFIPAVIALGTASYLGVVWSVDAKAAGAVCMLLAGAVAILNIRVNALVTGIFLAIELAALLVVSGLGFTHVHRGFDALVLHPKLVSSGGALTSVSSSLILTFVAIALFSYNGYQGAVFFSEETRGSSAGIARAILISLGITVAAELIPITAVLVGAPSLTGLSRASLPMTYFLKATSNSATNTLVSLGIALAIFNAVIAIMLQFGRVLYSSGRDRAWPGPLSAFFAAVHPRLKTPWLATASLAVVNAVLCLTVSLDTLIRLTGASLVADYLIIALVALVAPLTRATEHSPYRMPAWPLPPILAAVGLIYVTTKQTDDALRVTAITIVLGLAYWLVYLMPRRGRAWTTPDPVLDVDNQ